MIGKKITGLIISAVFSGAVFFTGAEVALADETDLSVAEETFTGENPYSSEIITGMDEDGNVYEWTDEVIEIEAISPHARAVEPLLVNFRTKSSYETTSYTEYMTGISGYTSGIYGADALYLGMENGKVKFMLAGVTGLVSPANVTLVSFSSAASYSHYMVNSSGRLIHYITTNLGGTSYSSKLDNGPAPSYLKPNTKYISYDGHYFYTADKYAVMQSDCNAGHRKHAVNTSDGFYNYFQYLPMRSYSDYSGSELSEAIHAYTTSSSKMNNLGSSLVENQDKYGTNALLVAAIAANESAWGTSNICRTKNNLFGINAIDSSPGSSANSFASPKACVKDYAETYLSKRYCRPEYKYYNGAFLGNKASGINLMYASDPYWGEKAAAIAWKLDGVNGDQDAYKYTIGIKDIISTHHNDVGVRKDASASSAAIHKTGVQSGQAFLIMDETPLKGFYKIQSNGVLNSARTKIDASTGKYSDFQMYLYISADYVTIVSKAKDSHKVEYNAHVSEIGWQPMKADGALAGTTGKVLPVEAISIRIDGIEGLGVTYRTHVRNIGWQDPVSDGKVAGTTGKALSVEAIEVSLTGEKVNQYDIYYSTHVSNVGWLGWAKNGAPAGSAGYAYPIEAIKIKLVKKGAAAPGSTSGAFIQKSNTNNNTNNNTNSNTNVSVPSLSCQAHVSNVGWMNTVKDGAVVGTTGRALPLEAVKFSVKSTEDLGISYSAHVRNVGWMSSVKNGAIAGTTGRALSMEAIKISLSGTAAKKYDIYYRAHVQNMGWLGWAKNGASSGSAGYALPMEAMEVRIVAKDSAAPGSTAKAFVQK